VTALLHERGVDVVEWSGWLLLDAYERALGEAAGRERTKVVDRAEMLRIAKEAAADADAAG
jgi:ferredoxin--NADP+ reductase